MIASNLKISAGFTVNVSNSGERKKLRAMAPAPAFGSARVWLQEWIYARPDSQSAAGSKRGTNFLLGKKIIRRRKEPFFETGGNVSANIAVKCQGTRFESGTVAPL